MWLKRSNLCQNGCYPDIKADNQFLVPNGVHLNELGNNILLNIIQGAIEAFIYDESKY
jgi:hypothetical protein